MTFCFQKFVASNFSIYSDRAGCVQVKKAIQKEVVNCFKKEQKPCVFKFRAPIKEGDYAHCILCDKFVEVGEFNEEQLEAGPGCRAKVWVRVGVALGLILFESTSKCAFK